ncbi:tyrosine-type recombinase/integrase [Roseinatronobacter bogoriensis]|uniref:Site-specific integrase n=1 Tax=Roseinatronobacter bogoriensis subsp. barguzinensis TaxID=441209 RepID=A0A2K8K9W5_9RHOB|nr:MULTISPECIES: site-specific integrase [Rhodobaca]ATX66237.1 site-specific integrase [Rhodobaca barguzinensis]MBB4207354.1 integrase [Rhodobaca bogoriensis DSM 18756]TDW40340.1 phage integrase family protein [Rhodobaca barguzinensis]TDY70508.1 phage integrase family protein [Rhodobaca bogoriensis DSM 18756]
MPKKARELSAKEVRDLKHPGKGRNVVFPVGGVAGLLLQITPTGARSWLMRTTVGSRRRDIGLGGFPDVTLAQARERAREAKDAIRQGIDPVEQRKAARAALVAAQARGLTFKQAWERFSAQKVKEFSTDRYRGQWKATVETYALPELGKMLVADITLQDILRVLQPLWDDKTVTAVKVRERVEKTLAWATVNGHREGPNPAAWRGNLEMVLTAPSKVSGAKNYPALQIDDAGRWWQALQAREGMGARALAFQALTATRSGAIRFATWDEIDLSKRLWTIQPGRQSSKIPANESAKRIPLTDDMVALLEALPKAQGSDLVFWAPKGGALSDATLAKVMRTIHEADQKAGGKGYVDAATGEAAVPHGLRSCFRSWVAERTGFDADMAEIALFHKVGSKVQQAYDRSDQVDKRRGMMQAWGDFLNGRQAEKVVQLQGARA